MSLFFKFRGIRYILSLFSCQRAYFLMIKGEAYAVPQAVYDGMKLLECQNEAKRMELLCSRGESKKIWSVNVRTKELELIPQK